MDKEKFSLIQIFGELPVSPEVFSTLDPKLKWLGECEEGGGFCTSCGTLSPKIPREHHKQCVSYMDLEDFPVVKSRFGDCPGCGSEDSLLIDSSREQRVSVIRCCDCDFSFSGSVDEERLERRFIKKFNVA